LVWLYLQQFGNRQGFIVVAVVLMNFIGLSIHFYMLILTVIIIFPPLFLTAYMLISIWLK